MRGSLSQRHVRLWVFGGIVTVVAHAAWLLFQVGGPTAMLTFSDIFGLLVPTVPGILCVGAARHHHGRVRWAWGLMAAALFSWGAGNTIWAFDELVRHIEVPYPGPADVGYLAFIPLLVAAVLCLPPGLNRSWTQRVKTWLDAAVVGGALFLAAWLLLLDQLSTADASHPLALVVTMAYPIGDLVLIAVVLVVATRGTDVSRHPVMLLGIGILATAFADFVYGYLYLHDLYASGALIDVVWTAGAVLIGIAAVRSRVLEDAPSHTVRSSRATPYLEYAAFVCVVPVVIYAYMAGRLSGWVFWAVIVFGIAMVGRLFIAIHENQRLAADLELRVAERTSELAAANAELRTTARLKEEFIANATHELRTPLTVISGALESLEAFGNMTPDQTPFLSLASSGSRRMGQLVDDLLVAAGLHAGMPRRREKFDVRGHVDLAIDGFTGKAAIDVWSSGKHVAFGDPERFVSALGHLLDNADKFRASDTNIRISVDSDGDHIVVVVANEGDPIPPEMREAVFDRFMQADGTTTRAHGGLGLGLYLARELMRLVGGDVTIEDTHTGCRVCLTVDLANGVGPVVEAPDGALPANVVALESARHVS